MAETKKERLLRYLNDAYAAEMGAIASIEDMIPIAKSGDLKGILEDQIDTAQAHADRVTKRIEALGGMKSDAKAVINQAGAKLAYFANIFHDKVDKDTQNATKVYALNELEVGMYTALQAYATAVEDGETALLAAQLKADEEQAATKALALIPVLAQAAVVYTSA